MKYKYLKKLFLLFEPELEASFSKEILQRFLLYRRILLIVGCVVLFFMAILDFKILYQNWQSYYIFRYAISMPVLFLFIVFSWTPWFKNHQHITLSAAVCFVSLVTFGWMVTESSHIIYFYSTGILLIILYAGIMLRLKFLYALFCVLFVVVGYFILIIFIRPQSFDFIMSQIIYCFGASAMIIVTAYYTENLIRHNFLTLSLLKLEKIQLKKANHNLEQLASQDALTGIANRRFFDERFTEECSRARREQYPISLLMIDIDHFKEFNDKYGHAAGDQCLIDFARALSETVKRPGDIVARYGGEEFIILLPKTNQKSAVAIAEKCLEYSKRLNIKHEDSPVANIVTASIGLITATPINNAMQESEELLEYADQALYKAKATGKNKFTVYQQ